MKNEDLRLKEIEAKKIFSENLRYFLNLNQKKQKDLSEYMGVSTGLVNDWCKGKTMPRIDKLKAICDWFGIEMSDLLTSKPRNFDEIHYTDGEVKRIAEKIYENADICELLEICIEMPPQKLKALLEFVKLSI